MLKRNLFRPADILLPSGCDMTLWSTVACDQFTSDRAYWDRVGEWTQNVPSTFHLMLPEAYLDSRDPAEESERIRRTMEEYLSGGVFTTVENSYVFVERTLPSGTVRRGLVGALDLEHYDFTEDSISPVRATEHTVESRLPARVAVRRQAPLEMPHIMVFIDDPADTVMTCAGIGAGETLYDFSLMCAGGHLRGRRVSGVNADLVTAMLDELTDEDTLSRKYGYSWGAVIYAVGDGNHSLAAAKRCWEEIRDTLSPEERENHPARFALVELVNIHDPGITFHPIHRTVFDIDPAQFAAAARETLFAPEGTEVTLIAGGHRETGRVHRESIGQVIEAVDRFCQGYAAGHGGRVDYIHGEAEAETFGARPDASSILLPKLEKAELFPSVMDTGVFCKKSFSIGEAAEKRYYLECRKIR